MNTLYVIGNGFDIAHGLDTKYWKFREYLDEHYPDFLYQFENLYDIAQIDIFDPRISKSAIQRWEKRVDSTLWSKFEDKMGKPNIQSMMDFSQSVLMDMDLDGGNCGIRDTMDSYWHTQYGFIRKFPQYVREWIESIDTSFVMPKKNSLIGSDDLFFSFNYTDVLEKVYHIENVLHVHGGVSSVTDIEPIMGHCNKDDIEQHEKLCIEADEVFSEGEASIHEAVTNYLKSLFKNTDELIHFHSWFWNCLSDVKHIVMIGWSVGEVDRPYLRKIRDSVSKDAQWTFYWYNEYSRDEIYQALSEEGIIDSFVVEDAKSDNFWD